MTNLANRPLSDIRLDIENIAMAMAMGVGDPGRVETRFREVCRELGEAIHREVYQVKVDLCRLHVTVIPSAPGANGLYPVDGVSHD